MNLEPGMLLRGKYLKIRYFYLVLKKAQIDDYIFPTKRFDSQFDDWILYDFQNHRKVFFNEREIEQYLEIISLDDR